MIKAIITDVDGVIVGKRHGVNFPLPNEIVIEKLRELQKKKIPVILCTAKFNFAILKIITQADLHNPHITDGGALIIDPLDNKVIKKQIFDKSLAHELVKKFIANDIYTEIYSADSYYLQKNHIGEFTEKRIRILQKEHVAVDSLIDKVDRIEVIKLLNFAHTEREKQQIEKILDLFKGQIHYVWSHHPTTLPSESTIVTIKGVSKKAASLEVLNNLNISPEETLGVGDTLGDWNFMSLCKYVGTVGDESKELKDLARAKGVNNYYFAGSVDENGFLEILKHFSL